MTARCRAAAAGALAAATLLVGLAAPAAAGPDDLVVTFEQPDDGRTLDSSNPTVAGSVKGRPGLIGTRVEQINVVLVRESDGTELQPTSGNGRALPGFSMTFRTATNGRYRAVVRAAGKGELLGLGVTEAGGTASRSFAVAAPPQAPRDVKVEVSPDRVVTVSWAKNTEADFLHYLVSRKNRDGETRVGQPDSGDRASIVDRGTTGGGDFTYQVVAVRRGATADSVLRSSTDKSVTVPAPPPVDPGSTVPGGTGAPGAPGDAAAAGGGPARADVSGFLAGQSGPSLPTPPRELEIPDNGFSSDLPFGSRPPGEELEEGDLEAEARTLDVGSSATEFITRGRPLVPVAGGAVLLLLAMHLRLLNKKVKAAPATVSGAAVTDLPPIDPDLEPDEPDGPDELHQVDDLPPPPPSSPPPAPPGPVLFDYEDAPPPAPAPVDDEVWSEDEWDEAQVQEFVSPGR